MGGPLSMLGGLDWELALFVLAGLVVVIGLVGGVRSLRAPERDDVIERIDRMVGREAPRAPADSGGGLWRTLARPFVALARPTRADELSKLRLQLQQAGRRSPHAMELFLASKMLLAVAPTMVFFHVNSRLVNGLVFPYDAAAVVWICAVGFLLPNMWLGGRIKKRQLEIERSLPDAMDLLVTCVEAGLGLDAALARVADELRVAAALLASELQLTFLEIQAGISRRDAFRRLSERTGVEDLKQLSAVLAQTEMFGTSIARALRLQADAMRVRRMQRAEERAGMVGVKMTVPLILCILPALIAVVVGPAVVSIATNIIKDGR